MQKVTTFLMFEGQAEAAINLYMSLFPDSKILSIQRYGAEGPGREGTVVHAVFTLNGQEFMCIDSPAKHGFTFTPATSLFITCDTEAEVDALFGKLSDGGKTLMPLDAYPFAKRYGWCEDRFGVSWQISLPVAN